MGNDCEDSPFLFCFVFVLFCFVLFCFFFLITNSRDNFHEIAMHVLASNIQDNSRKNLYVRGN